MGKNSKKRSKLFKKNIKTTLSICEYFKLIEDPRDRRGLRHELWEALTIIIYGLLCGHNTMCAIERLARRREKDLKKHLPLKNGIPSHCTLSRILQMINYEELFHVFLLWMDEILASNTDKDGHITLDGKGVKASGDSGSTKVPYVLNALLEIDGFRLYIGLLKIEKKSNEIPYMVPLLSLLRIANKVVTIDAMGTHHDAALFINEREGMYVLPLKGNNKAKKRDSLDHIREMAAAGKAGYHRTEGKEHGRFEVREHYFILYDDEFDDRPYDHAEGVGLVKRYRKIIKTGEESFQEVCFITNGLFSVEQFADNVRSHWACEIRHWILDEHMKEDRSTAKTGFSLENLALLRRIAYNIIQIECETMGVEQAGFATHFITDSKRIASVLFSPLPVI